MAGSEKLCLHLSLFGFEQTICFDLSKSDLLQIQLSVIDEIMCAAFG
jgi:hypothetical protein